MKNFVGKRVLEIRINQVGDQLALLTDQDETLWVVATSDCCSESFFNDVLGIRNLIGEEITKVEERELPHLTYDDPVTDDRTLFYSLVISTRIGYCDIIFRNESNGYYTGSFAYEPWTRDRNIETWTILKSDFENGFLSD